MEHSTQVNSSHTKNWYKNYTVEVIRFEEYYTKVEIRFTLTKVEIRFTLTRDHK